MSECEIVFYLGDEEVARTVGSPEDALAMAESLATQGPVTVLTPDDVTFEIRLGPA